MMAASSVGLRAAFEADMQIHISGQQIDIGDALRAHVTDKLNAGVAKYFDHSLEANVAFSRDGEGFACVASVHVFAGLTLRAEGGAQDIYAAFDQAAERIEKRLRRYKGRLKSHKGRHAEPDISARDAVIQAEPDDDAPEPVNGEPVVVAESVAAISTLRVGDAVMRLDISGAPVVVFRNAGHGALNVVYRRPDGHIGWIDPSFDPKP
jgi:ribosomal subunit interface protein